MSGYDKYVRILQKLSSKALEYGKPRLVEFLKYARVELIPPSPTEVPQIGRDIVKLLDGAKRMAFLETPVREAWLNVLIGLEVGCWFWVGECIGKGSIVGYQI